MLKQLFSFKGRSNRVDYAINMLVYIAILATFIFTEPAVHAYGDAGAIVTLILIVLMLWIFIATMAKRFHDIGKNGWAVLLVLIPLVGQITPFALLVYPGSDHDNEFGRASLR
jgi:uncharacterized membrane protein YhaH (DUF805 family)